MALVAMTIVLVSFTPTSEAKCRCDWEGPFASVALTTDVVVLGVVSSYLDNSFIFDVEEVWGGQESRRTIQVYTNNGDQCRPKLNKFKLGDRWLLAVDRVSTAEGLGAPDANSATTEQTAYALSDCGEFFVVVRSGAALGRISGMRREQQRAPLDELRTAMISRLSR